MSLDVVNEDEIDNQANNQANNQIVLIQHTFFLFFFLGGGGGEGGGCRNVAFHFLNAKLVRKYILLLLKL